MDDIGLISAVIGILSVVAAVVIFMYRQSDGIRRLLLMHESPDENGFGSASVLEQLRQNAQASREQHEEDRKARSEERKLMGDLVKEHNETSRHLTTAIEGLTHYVEWIGENTTGQKPPPPV